MEIFRRTKNRNIKCVRWKVLRFKNKEIMDNLEEVLKNQTVYDLEIADNNNYFADNILVSNCTPDNNGKQVGSWCLR